MAFSDALRGAGSGTADVVLRADTGQFNAEVDQAERNWRESIGSMSKEALKLDLAQDRLKRSLAQYGAESAQAKRATIGLKEAEEAAARAADRHAREVRELDRAQGRARISARGLVGSVAGLAAGYLGAQGLIAATKTALDASSNLAEQQDFANRIFKDSTVLVERYARDALGLARDQAYEAASGIGALLVKFTDSDREAARLSVTMTKLGVDLASIKNTGVEEALTAIKSGLVGESEPLRRYAVLLSAARVEQEALRMTGKASAKQLTEGEEVLARVNLILREAAYAQGNYADTIESTANQEREAQKNFRNTAILIGDTLQPAYRELLRRVNEYLGDAENQRRIQEQVNDAIETGEDVVRGFMDALKLIKAAGEPLLDFVGGLENAVKLATVAWVAFKIKAIAGFGATALASRVTSAKLIADAAAAGRAWDIATRPRTLIVTPTTTPGVPGAPGAPGTPTKKPPIIPVYGAPLTVAAATALGIWSLTRDKSTDPRNTGKYVPKGYPGAGMTIFWRPDRKVFTYGLTDEVVPAYILVAVGLLRSATSHASPDTTDPRRPGATTQSGSSSGGGSPRPPRTIADILLDQARAETTPGTADDLRFHRELAARYQRQIDALEARKSLSAKQKQLLTQLYGDLAREQAAINAIIAENEQKLDAQEQAAAEKRRRQQEARERAQERKMEQAMRAAQRQYDRFESLQKRYDLSTRAGLRAAAIRGLNAGKGATKTATSSGGGPSGLDFVREFLSLQSQYGPNFFPEGSFRFPERGSGANVTVNQNFPTAPSDYFREARWAQQAAVAVFDG